MRHWGKYRDIGRWPVSMIDTVKGTVVALVRVGYNPNHLPVVREGFEWCRELGTGQVRLFHWRQERYNP